MIDKEKRQIKIGLKKVILIAIVFIIVIVIGIIIYTKSNKNLPNFITKNEKTDNKEDNTVIARELFEKAIKVLRDGIYNEIDTKDTKTENGIIYAKSNMNYTDLKLKYEEIFAANALENVLKENAINENEIAYVIPKENPKYTIEITKIEIIENENEEYLFKAEYIKEFVDTTIKEENSCTFKIKKINEEYKIIEISYMGLNEKEKTSSDEYNQLDKHIENEMGIKFDYSSKWEFIDNNKGSGIVIIGLKKPNNNSNEYTPNVEFAVSYKINKNNTSAKKIREKETKELETLETDEIDIAGYQGYSWVGNPKDNKNNELYKAVYVKIDSLIYKITYGGYKDLYYKYYETFEKMLKSIEFYKPTYIEEWQKQDYDNFKIEEKQNNNTGDNQEKIIKNESKLIGDTNCDGIINVKDLITLTKYTDNEIALTEQERINSDLNEDSSITVEDIEILKLYLVGTITTLPQKTNYSICGDANCDGTVNNEDITAITKYIYNGVKLSSNGIDNADVNDDRMVNDGDINVLTKYIEGEFDILPYRTSGKDMKTKEIGEMKVSYPANWIAKEETQKNIQPGEPIYRFEGDIYNVEMAVVAYKPLTNAGNYKNLFKNECQKYGIAYYEGMEEIDYYSENRDINWRYLIISNGLRCFYYIDSNTDKAYKVEVRILNYTEKNNLLATERIIHDTLLGTKPKFD